jgi:hypothetical protein
MKLPKIISYLIVMALPVYLVIAFSIGFGIGAIPFILYDRYWFTDDVIIVLIFRSIPSIIAGFGAAYLAYVPIRFFNKKTNFYKDNFSN